MNSLTYVRLKSQYYQDKVIVILEQSDITRIKSIVIKSYDVTVVVIIKQYLYYKNKVIILP